MASSHFIYSDIFIDILCETFSLNKHFKSRVKGIPK